MRGFGARGAFFIALVGEPVLARSVAEREALSDRLSAELEGLQESRVELGLVSGLGVAREGELVGLFFRPVGALRTVVSLADALHPRRLLWGAGLGTLSGSAEDPQRAEGPALDSARAALHEARRSGSWLEARGFGEGHERAVGALMRLAGELRARWTDKQARYALAARHAPQKEVAARYSVSPSVVSESLKAAHAEGIRRAEEAAGTLLDVAASIQVGALASDEYVGEEAPGGRGDVGSYGRGR